MSDQIFWEQVGREIVYDSKFLKVYEDTVKLPNGTIIDDYTVVEKPSIVMIVATTSDKEVITLKEYKYAANELLLTLPAGHMKDSETSIDAARRELLEETGFSGKEFEEVGILHDYPTKDLHKVYVVRASNVAKTSSTKHEATEIISYSLNSVREIKQQIDNKEWKASSALAALTLSGILF